MTPVEIITECLNIKQGQLVEVEMTMDIMHVGRVTSVDDFEFAYEDSRQNHKTFEVHGGGEVWTIKLIGHLINNGSDEPAEFKFVEPLAKSPEGGVYRIKSIKAEED